MASTLRVEVQSFLASQSASVENDQFFCIDERVLEAMVAAAQLQPDDRVLEVGPGLGFLTRHLAMHVHSVLAVELDNRFAPYLAELPGNVEVIYGDAYRLLNDRKFRKQHIPPTKVVSNIPYSRAQNMLHNYTSSPWYQGDIVWLAPITLAEKVNEEPILGAYFHAEVVREVPRNAFYPQPDTLSAIIYFHRVPDPRQSGDFAIYMRRWFYKHEDVKVKNMLREGIVKAAWDLQHVRITKNEARQLIDQLALPPEDLELLTNNIPLRYYAEIPSKLAAWFDGLQKSRVD